MSKDTSIIPINDEFNKDDETIYTKSFMFIKGFCIAENYEQTLIALAIARKLHDGQYRKDGSPYITHPLKVCSTLIDCGIRDDITLAASLLHDILEDCQDKLPLDGRELISEFSLNKEVLDICKILTKESDLDQHELSLYFNRIKRDPKALLIKLADRLHNSATLYAFSPDKLKKYTKETNDFILPMASYGKLYYPKYTNAISILKSNIYSLNHSMEVVVESYENHLKEIKIEHAEEVERLKTKLVYKEEEK